MSRLEAWTVHLSLLLVGGTGLVYAWMRYLLEPVDPFAVVHHPLQPAVQHGHIWTAPLLVFAVGLIWRQHVWSHVRSKIRARRVSGWSLLVNLVPMIASGYLIQTAVSPGWRTAWIGIHLVTSGIFLAGYLGHQVAPVLARARRRRRRAAALVPGVRGRDVEAPRQPAGTP